MTEVKHTPGPWLVEENTVYVQNAMGVNRFSATVQGGYTGEGKTQDDELQANFRAIASVPEMRGALDAARKAMERISYLVNVDRLPLPEDDYVAMREAFRKVVTALAKSTA